jgi:ABC-type nitrate/sulfonate/bicarbonate transport system substrate-binding protein
MAEASRLGGARCGGAAAAGLIVSVAAVLLTACAPTPPAPGSSAAVAAPPGAVGGVGVAQAPGSPPREPVDVTIAIVTRSTAQLPEYVGLKGGFFEQEGVRLTLQQMPTPAGILAMIDGQVGYSTSGASIIRAAASGRPVKLIAGGKNAPDWQLFVQPEIASVADLRGRRVGVLNPTGAATLVTHEILEKYGVGSKDLESINLQNTEGIFAGLVAKQIHGGLLSPPFTVYAAREGLKYLLKSADEVQVLQGGLGTSEQRLRERPDEVDAVLRGLVRSTRALFEDRELVLGIIAEQFDLPRDVVVDIYADVAEAFERTATASDEVIRREIAGQEEAIGEKLNVGPADVSDFSLLRRAHEALASRERARS